MQSTRLSTQSRQSMAGESTEKQLSFKINDVRRLCWQILLEKLPFGPHDYELDVLTRILDKENVIAASATGSGKSAYIYMVMIIILAISENPSLCPFAKFPNDPAMVVVCPTTALEEDLINLRLERDGR
ncbi:hypothetical protein BDZ97DRAFT_1801925 [Flammula alnicola]|nr:hypothetical protein BDZ97DRAFT_1801925 [Flammula alnicola]